jgi:hypothetical protein
METTYEQTVVESAFPSTPTATTPQATKRGEYQQTQPTTAPTSTDKELDYSAVRESAIVNGHEVPKMLLFLEERTNENFGWTPYSFVQMKRFRTKAATVGFVVSLALAGTLLGGYAGWLAVKARVESTTRVNIANCCCASSASGGISRTRRPCRNPRTSAGCTGCARCEGFCQH